MAAAATAPDNSAASTLVSDGADPLPLTDLDGRTHVPAVALLLVDAPEAQRRPRFGECRQTLLEVVLDGGGVEGIGKTGVAPGVVQRTGGPLAHCIEAAVRRLDVGLLTRQFSRLCVHRDAGG